MRSCTEARDKISTVQNYVDAMQRISGWEQAQNSLGKATLRDGGDFFPV